MKPTPGFASNPLLKKIGIRNGMRIAILDLPAGTAGAFSGIRSRYSPKLDGEFDSIHFFAESEKGFLANFPKAKKHLKPTGMLWVSWPKSGGLGTDLTMKSIIRLGYGFGMVESKCISIDPLWSALKFTFPKKGREYRNSYGRLE